MGTWAGYVMARLLAHMRPCLFSFFFFLAGSGSTPTPTRMPHFTLTRRASRRKHVRTQPNG